MERVYKAKKQIRPKVSMNNWKEGQLLLTIGNILLALLVVVGRIVNDSVYVDVKNVIENSEAD